MKTEPPDLVVGRAAPDEPLPPDGRAIDLLANILASLRRIESALDQESSRLDSWERAGLPAERLTE
jgi:hypothetical protein